MSDIGDYTHSDIYSVLGDLEERDMFVIGIIGCVSFLQFAVRESVSEGRFVNDIMGRWHDTPESRVPAGCTRLRPWQYGVALSDVLIQP